MKLTTFKKISPIFTLLSALLFLSLGICALAIPKFTVQLFMWGLAVVIAVSGVSRLIALWSEKKRLWGVVSLLVHLALCAGLILFKPSFLTVFNILVGVIAFVIGLLRAAICLQYALEKIPGAFRNGLSALVCMVFAVLLFVNPISNTRVLLIIAGIYSILYAVTLINDFFAELFRTDLADNKLKRRIHIALPNILTAFIPNKLINRINKSFQQNEINQNAIATVNAAEGYDHVDLEVFIHMSEDGFGRFGHADICFGDTVYSYGCYDLKAHKLGGMISEGTMAIAPREPYIHHCLTYEKKVLVGFGFCLSPLQKQAVQDRINEFMQVLQPWESDFELAKAQGKSGKEFEDPASALVRATGGKVYKVASGPFKTYFAVSTNCVQLADWITGSSGIDVLSFNGIRTPGAYYSLLSDLFERQNTIVVRRTVYLDPETKKEQLSEIQANKPV